MWKLIIHQKKQHEKWESEQEVAFVFNNIIELSDFLVTVGNIQTSSATWYEIREESEESNNGRVSEDI